MKNRQGNEYIFIFETRQQQGRQRQRTDNVHLKTRTKKMMMGERALKPKCIGGRRGESQQARKEKEIKKYCC